MQGTETIEVRKLLWNWIMECWLCKQYYSENVWAMVDNEGFLSDEQIVAVLIRLNDYHQWH